jgi:methylphosphotriester-DNA--protein-cysteine methyltransferase
MEQLRHRYGITTAGHFPLPPKRATFDEAWLNQIARKTGVEAATVRRLFQQIAWIESTQLQEIAAEDLLQLSRLIEDFYRSPVQTIKA